MIASLSIFRFQMEVGCVPVQGEKRPLVNLICLLHFFQVLSVSVIASTQIARRPICHYKTDDFAFF